MSRANKALSVPAPAPLAVGMRQAASLCSLGRTNFLGLVAAGKGPGTFMIGGRRLVRVAELDRWLIEREAGSA